MITASSAPNRNMLIRKGRRNSAPPNPIRPASVPMPVPLTNALAWPLRNYGGLHMAAASFDAFQRGQASAFVSGTGIGTLAGLVGLGGAEVRRPFLTEMVRFGGVGAV